MPCNVNFKITHLGNTAMKKIILLLASLLGSSTLFAESVPAVSPQQAAQMQSEQKAIILDVRENDEWNAGHIAGAIHIPLGEISNRVSELAKYQNQPVITQCRSGARSAKAANMLKTAGFNNVHNMDGGLNAWQNAALKTTVEN
jgi:rhodanese-related sulfurtransferase